MSAVVGVEGVFEAIDARTLEILANRSAGRLYRRRGWLVRRALVAADVLGLTSAFLAAEAVYAVRSDRGSLGAASEVLVFAASLPAWIVAAKLYGLYDRDEERADHSTVEDFAGLFHLITVCTFALYAGSQVTRWFHPELWKLLVFWALAISGTALLRSIARGRCRRRITYLQNTLLVGAGDTGQGLARKLLNHPEYGLNLVGFVDSHPKERGEALQHLTVLGGLDDLEKIVDLLDVERVIVAFTGDQHEALLDAIAKVRRRDVQVDILPRLFDELGPSAGIHAVEGVPLVSLPPVRLSNSSFAIKRSLDIAVAGVALLALLPLLACIALLVKVDSAGPAFYRHERVGRRGKSLGLLKFRTMYADLCRGTAYGGDRAEEAFARLMADPRLRAEFERSYKLQSDPRVTRLGRVLRRTSLDELPQLWNVIRGDISLVGPRALTAEELQSYYGDSANAVLELPPGITGYWQINGRSDLDYADRVRLDLAYIGGWSLALDLQILARTVRVFLSGGGAV